MFWDDKEPGPSPSGPEFRAPDGIRKANEDQGGHPKAGTGGLVALIAISHICPR